jgi:predicted metal-dependent phosphoesterase TrpH
MSSTPDGHDEAGVRAITHVHTRHSWDSRIPIDRLADTLVARGIGLVLVNDHNSFAGSLELARVVEDRGLALIVPVAAEIRTDRGDVIVAFEPGRDPPGVDELTSWADLPGVVSDLGGLIWLPHPYQSHTDVEELAAVAEVIEVFNARCSPDQNRQAADLCRRHRAVPGYGADIHRAVEIGRFHVEYQAAPTVLETFRREPSHGDLVRTRRSDVMAAEVTNGFKRRRPTLVGYFALKWVKHRVKELAGAGRATDG